MAKTCTGSVQPRGKGFRASVPRLKTAPKRLYWPFAIEHDAWRWVEAQLERRSRGLEPEPPAEVAVDPPTSPVGGPRSGRAEHRWPDDLPTLGDFAWGWHGEYYDEMHGAQAGRTEEVRRLLDRIIVPTFTDLLRCDIESGRAMVKDWLRVSSGRPPLTEGSTFAVGSIYAQCTINGYLWMLRQILAYGRNLGYDIPAYADGASIRSLRPVGRPRRRRAPLVSVADTAEIAAQLHVVHQLVLWLLRLAGLRISESYGLLVANFFVDDDGHGFLVAGPQGGKTFLARNDRDEVEASMWQEFGKSDSATRLIALPALLTALILKIIQVFHTLPDGSVDMTARLVPQIRSATGGQGGFRTALRAAAEAVGGSDDEDAYVRPHDLRKNFATDLAWSDDVSGLVARRAMGHRAGSDVFDLVYTLDSRLKEHLRPVAAQMERELADGGLTTLMVPTRKRPVWGRSLDPGRSAEVDAELEGAGWYVDGRGSLLSARDVAAYLGREVKVVRRLFPDTIPAVKRGGEWFCREADVLAFVRRTEGLQLLTEVVERADVDRFTVRRTMDRLGISTTTDESVRGVLLTEADADRIVNEIERVRRLHDRAISVQKAAAVLGVHRTVIHRWLDSGRLIRDLETDATEGVFVSRASVDAEVAARGGSPSATITVDDVRRISGFTEAEVQALMAAGFLARERRDRVTTDSVRRWAAGHRPELLADPILNGTPGRSSRRDRRPGPPGEALREREVPRSGAERESPVPDETPEGGPPEISPVRRFASA